MSDPIRKNRTRLIGVGNKFRSDDSVGLVIANRLAQKNIPALDIIEYGGDGATLMELWSGYEKLIIVDAVRSGSKPGKIWRLDAAQQKIPSEFFNYSTHAFSVAEAVELGRTLDLLPPQLIIYGIEGADFSFGTDLTEPVLKASEELIHELIELFGN